MNCVVFRPIVKNGLFAAGGSLADEWGMLVKAPFSGVTREVISAAIEVHRILWPGLLESAYRPCLQYELSARKLRFVTECPVPVVYKGMPVASNYRLDLLVDDVVAVEVKAAAGLAPIHQAQLLTYLHLLQLPVGLLINFNVAKLINGVKRVINPRAPGVW